jgi:AraC family transcriptional regulator
MVSSSVMRHEPVIGTGRVEALDARGEELGGASWSQGRIVLTRRSWAARAAKLQWQAPFHSLLLTERGTTARTRVRAEGRVVYDGGDRAGVLSVVPAGLEREASYRDAEIVYAALWFDPVLKADLLGAHGDSSLPLRINAREPVVASLLADLSASTARGTDPGTLYVEHLVGLAWSRLARPAACVRSTRRAAPMDARSLARVDEYVRTHLSADLSVTDLARALELAPDTFARKLKAATGLSPHAFVLERRVERAMQLLAETHSGIAAIAHEVGFSSQSHLTEVFRRRRGTTPHAYRRAFRPVSR